MTTKIKKLGLILLALLCTVCMVIATVPAWKAQAAEVEPTGKVELYQLAPSQNLYEGYVIKTADGSLIVIDGGAETGAETPAYIDAALTAIAGTENYTVDYWFLSHAHSDHIYELAKILNKDTINFTVNNFVFDFPNFVQTGDVWHADFATYCKDLSYDAWALLKTGLDNYAAKKGYTVTEASYYDEVNGAIVNGEALADGPITISVDNVDIEILQTYSTSDTTVNSNSMIMRVWVDEQSVLFLNDATVESGNRLIETYGREFLKSDIVQMAHHGQNGTAKNVYDAVDAKVRLWPAFDQVWNNTKGSYQTDEVRTWVGLPAKAEDFVQSEYDIVAGLAITPADSTSSDAWDAVLDGMKISLPYLPAVENKFEMKTGASIRLTSGSTGIRFSANLASYDPDAEYGVVIAPRAWFDSLGVTENYTAALIAQKGEENIIKLNSNVVNNGGRYIINGSIANIKTQNINLNFTGMAYCYKNGVYTDAYVGSLDDITRSVSQVATAALNHDLYTDYDYGDNLSIIEGFVNTSVNNAEYSLAFTNANTALELYESKELALTTNLKLDRAVWTSSDETVATVSDGVVTAVGIGEAIITVKSAGKEATCTVTVTAETDAVLSFSNKASEQVATKVPTEIRPSRSASLIEAEWLESYKGAQGVLKVTAMAQSYSPYVSDIRIELPKAITTGVTVRMLVEDFDATYLYFYAGEGDYANLGTVTAGASLKSYEKGIWTTRYIDYKDITEDNKALNILIQGGSAYTESVIYFDIIESGDTTANYDIMDIYGGIADPLADKLTGKYLADFSDDAYESLVVDDTYGRKAENIVAERLETYDGVKNVMKVTTYNASSGSCFGDFTMILPKAMGDTGYTIRFMIAETTSTGTALRILNPRTEVSKIKEYSYANILGKWQEVFIAYTDKYKNEVTFQIWGNADGVNVFYIDYVADGDCVEEMAAARKSEIANALTGDYLADFSNSVYKDFVGYSSYSANVATSITTEYLETYADANGVIKITANAQANGRGNIVINLPKASTSGKMTVKFMVPTCNSTYNGFIDPGTNATLVSSQFTTSTTWQYLVLNQASCEYDCIEILFANNGAVTNVVYIDAIMEGDKVAELKAEALENTKAALVAGLADGELANFSSEGYKDLAAKNATTTNMASSLTAEWLEYYTDADGATDYGVLKVTSVNNGSKRGNIKINLPKASDSGKMTVKFMVEAGSETMWFVDPDTSAATDIKTIAGGGTSFTTSTTWQVMTLNQENYEHDSIELLFANTSGATNVVYFACVMEGDQTEAINNEIDRSMTATTRETLAGSLTDNYLADFSSSDYASLAFARNGAARAAASVTAEKLDLYEGESNVLKIDLTNNSSGIADLKLFLPKAASTSTITVKIWVESASTYVRFLQPNTNSGAYLSDGTTIADITTGSWQTMSLYYNNISIRDQLDIMIQGGISGATNTVYIAYVIDGAEDVSSASTLFNGNEEFILFADKPPQGDTTRVQDYVDAGFTHYVITEDQKSLFVKDANTGEYTVDEAGNYILNTEYLGFINNAINAGLDVIMRNMGNKPDYFDKLTADQISTLQSIIDGYYMCDEPSHTYKSTYTESTYVEALSSLVDWYNTNGKDENGDYTLFHVNLLQSYGIEELLHKNDGITFEEYVSNYVETILKGVNGTKTISTDYYALASDGTDNYIKSDFLRNLYVIANTAKTLKENGHDVITNFCIQLCDDEGLSLRLMESVDDVRFQTALYAAFGATSYEYYGYLGYMYNQSDLSKYDTYDYVATVNAELQNLAKAISLFDWNGYQFISYGDSTVTNIEGTQLSAFSGLSSVTSTADAVVSEFKYGDEFAYMAVNYTEPSDNISNTVTFTFSGETAATVYINGVRSDVELVNGVYSATLGAGDSVFVYAYKA